MLPDGAHQLVADHDTRTSGSFMGPLPPPSLLASYDAVKPGLAERIVKMAETQAAHRQSMEARLLDASIFASKAGMFCGLTIAMAVLSCSAWIAAHGAPWPGSLLGVGDLTALVAVFVTRQYAKGARGTVSAQAKEMRKKPAARDDTGNKPESGSLTKQSDG